MTNYLRGLVERSDGVRRQYRGSFKETFGLPLMNPYGRDFFSISQTSKAEHMYPDVLLLKSTDRCGGECAHCFRQYERNSELEDITPEEISRVFGEYVPTYNEQHGDKIREVLVTGGDPLMLPQDLLENILRSAKDSGIEFIRIGSRSSSVTPHLVTDNLLTMLRNYQPLIMVGHYNHVDELTRESLETSERILNAGIRMKNQSVLLRGVNDDVDGLGSLFWELNKNGIQPYRLYHCMPVGYEELRTTVREGIELTRKLQEVGGTIGHFDFSILTPFGKVVAPTEDHILDEKQGNELVGEFPEKKLLLDARYLKLRVTSKTTKDDEIPKEAWYMDGREK